MSTNKKNNIIENEEKEGEQGYDVILPERPELKNRKIQKLKFLCPPSNLPYHPNTLFFYYDPKLNKNPQTKLKIIDYEIKERKFMVLYKAYQNLPLCLSEPMKYNNIIRTKLFDNTNIIWKLLKQDKMFPLLKELNKYQKYNHFPITWQLSRKDNLYNNYKKLQIKFPNDFKYMPETFVLPKDKEIFTLQVQNYELNKNNIWLLKPVASSRGRGIRILTNFNDIPEKTIITHYISNPHLIDNTKYNLRFYVLVTGFCPLKIYLYKEGFANFASQKYNFDINEKGLNNKNIHITKHLDNINQKDEENDSSSSSSSSSNSESKYSKNEDNEFGKVICLSELKKWFKERKLHFSKIKRKIRDIIIKTFISIADKGIQQIKEININSGNLFELFGVDIILDNKLRPWLLEINLNPNLNCSSFIEDKIKSKLITDTLNIIGLIPYSHDGKYKIYDKEDKYKDNIEEAINETLHEFERPCGDFKRIFPLIENIDLYSKYLENPGEENLALWDVIHKKNK